MRGVCYIIVDGQKVRFYITLKSSLSFAINETNVGTALLFRSTESWTLLKAFLYATVIAII